MTGRLRFETPHAMVWKDWWSFMTIMNRRLSAALAFLFLLLASGAAADGYGVPRRTDDNLIVASYNVKWLGQSEHDLSKLALVIQHFDVCGIIEVKREAAVRALAVELDRLTGRKWGYCYGVRTNRPKGSYREAYAVLWRTDRASLGNGIVSNVWDPDEIFRNDPYAVSFFSGNFDFTLLLAHTRWEADEEGSREGEIGGLIAQRSFFAGFLEEKDIIVAGDFNYSGTAVAMARFAEAAALSQIDPNLATTFKNDGGGYLSPYDHIFISMECAAEFTGESGVLDSTLLVYGDRSAESMKRSKSELSDHLPVWAVFSTVMEDDD